MHTQKEGIVGLDCVIIGYNDPPFDEYEALLRRYGRHSEAYRDLQFSFADVDGRPRPYVDLLNLAAGAPGTPNPGPFHSGAIPNLAAAYLTAFLRQRGYAAEYINL